MLVGRSFVSLLVPRVKSLNLYCKDSFHSSHNVFIAGSTTKIGVVLVTDRWAARSGVFTAADNANKARSLHLETRKAGRSWRRHQKLLEVSWREGTVSQRPWTIAHSMQTLQEARWLQWVSAYVARKQRSDSRSAMDFFRCTYNRMFQNLWRERPFASTPRIISRISAASVSNALHFAWSCFINALIFKQCLWCGM